MRALTSVMLVSWAKAFTTHPSFLFNPAIITTSSRVTTARTSYLQMSSIGSKPFAVIVEAEILPERMDEFLKLIQTNAENTRKEPGCIRFDVLRSMDNPNQFFFYELYSKVEDIEYHKQQPHYNLWAEFKASGGVVNSVTHKTDGEFLT